MTHYNKLRFIFCSILNLCGYKYRKNNIINKLPNNFLINCYNLKKINLNNFINLSIIKNNFLRNNLLLTDLILAIKLKKMINIF
jgi:hypothetical protein